MSHDFFQNVECKYFPCHDVDDLEEFSCLFCYCPLYALGEGCGGDFVFTEKGVKNCKFCVIPHTKENYDYVTDKCQEIIEMVRKRIV
ncbi:MAG: cysteine-rich small domain-containing protein [Eubacteriaceae bacterium]|nr:cysteine-rich small domain-containing protein [Eubacteriaceae bacterium]